LPVFSVARLYSHIFTVPNLEAGFVTLIAVDVVWAHGVVPEIRMILERCIHLGQDVLLPSVSDAEPVGTFLIIACTDANGSAVIASRISRELQDFNASKVKPSISSTTLLVGAGQSRDEQIGAVTAQVDRLVQAHLVGKQKVN